MARSWVKIGQTRHSSMANTDQHNWTWLITGYGNEPGGEFYNDGIQIWSVDLRSKLQPYRNCMIDAIMLECWSRKKKHSGRHYWWLTPIMMDPGSLDPRNKPWSQIGRNVAISSINYSDQPKDGVPSYIRSLELNTPLPVSRYLDRCIPFGCCGDLNSARSYGFCSVVALSLYQESPGFPGWASNVMQSSGNAVPGWASQMITGNWLTNVRSGRQRLFNVNTGTAILHDRQPGDTRYNEIETYLRSIGITNIINTVNSMSGAALHRRIRGADIFVYIENTGGRTPGELGVNMAQTTLCSYMTINEALQWARTGRLTF